MAQGGFRTRVTDRLVSFLEENGSLPFQSGPEGLSCSPFNPVSGKRIRGGNAINLILGALERGSNDPRWMTLDQANQAGYRLRRNAKCELVQYWDWGRDKRDSQRAPDQTAADASAGAPSPTVAAADGSISASASDEKSPPSDSPRQRAPTDTTAKAGDSRPLASDVDAEADQRENPKPSVFNALVYNGSDIVGLPEMSPDLPWRPDELAKQLLAATGVAIEHRAPRRTGRRRAPTSDSSYDAATGRIIMPPRESFKSDPEYYASALRQLAYWANHRSDADPSVEPGTPEAAKRELRTELAANLLTSMVGLEGARCLLAHSELLTPALKRDRHELFRAAREAEQLVEYVFDFAPDLKAVLDTRIRDNILEKRPKRLLDSGVAPLPNFIPPQAAAAPVRTGRADPRWRTFESSVQTESKKYGISADIINETLRLLERQFTDVMNAAESNGYTVGDMNSMLVTQLVEEMRANNHRDQTWIKYCEQVRKAGSDLMPAERIEAELQHIGRRYRELAQEGATQNWENDRTEGVLNELLFGQNERCPITPEYIRRRFLANADQTMATQVDDDAFLTPIAASLSVDDSFPADAAPLPDEPVATTPTARLPYRVGPAPTRSPHRERQEASVHETPGGP